jgi:3-oxoacyl-[acyl-carrier protein] reductase
VSVAVVTGGGRGIGRATALRLAERGHDVAVIARTEATARECAARVEKLGKRALAIACDVSRELDVDRASERIARDLGVPDVVVHAAGVVHRGATVETTSTESWDEVIGVNLRGPFLLTRAFLPAMRKRGSGRIVFVGSISSTMGCPGVASYAASKWGLVGFAKSLAEELRGTNLVAISVLPGSVDTEMLKGSGFEPAMSADDVASTIVYAALDAPAAMTGSTIEMFG